MSRVVFEWPDAWIFASLRGAGEDAGTIDFAKLVATADALDHAIVTAEEVRGALAKLHVAGLVEVADGRVTVTPLAPTLHEKIAAMRGGPSRSCAMPSGCSTRPARACLSSTRRRIRRSSPRRSWSRRTGDIGRA